MRWRKRLRHPSIDYGVGSWFFVTVCAARRGNVFGEVRDHEVRLNRLGWLVADRLADTTSRFDEVVIDDSIVMPDHVHAIIGLEAPVGGARQASPLRLGTVVGSFKSAVSRELGEPIWQRGCYDHRIRDERDLDAIRAYIRGNPSRWRAREV